MLKAAPPRQLAEAVRTAASGETLLAPTITRRLVERYVRVPPPGSAAGRERFDELTDREGEVLVLIARGLSVIGGDGQDPRDAQPLQARIARSRAGGGADL